MRHIQSCGDETCHKNGECFENDSGEVYCNCNEGFEGADCSINVFECLSLPCKNGGTCHVGIRMYTCSCLPGYIGVNCEFCK